MLNNLKRVHVLGGMLFSLVPLIAVGQSALSGDPVEMAQQQITAYLSSLADLHCTESVTQEKFAANGHLETKERAKYDYLIMMEGTGDDFQLNETRVEADSKKTKTSATPMLVSNGAATVLLVFHPYYRDSFKFEAGTAQIVDGKTLIPVHFEHIPGRRSPAALALRGREYPLDLEGTAWLDRATGQVAKIEAGLLRDMSDVGLRSLQVHVDYKPVQIGKSVSTNNLPTVAVVEVETPRQHWRNTHVFSDYKSFSTDAEQDPNVKIHASNEAGAGADQTVTPSPGTKEKP